MQGRAIKTISICIVAMLLCGCLRQRSVRQGEAATKTEVESVKPSTLSEYIRTVYKLSSEGAHRKTEERATLLLQNPELEALASRIESNPTDAEARSQLVSAYIDHRLYWDAHELLTASLSDDAESNLHLATIWDAWGQFDLALKYANRALTKGASSAQAYELMGGINLHRRVPAEAISWYERAAKQGENAAIMANLGFAHMLRSDWENAKISLQRAIELDETLPEPHNNLAMVLTKLGDEKGAMQELLKTATAPVAFNNMGVLYLEERNFDRARQFFEEALKLEPRYEVAQNNLRTVEALAPPATIVTVPSFQEHPPIPNVECPPTEDAPTTAVNTDTPPSIPEETSFVGPTGIVGSDDPQPELETSGSESDTPLATASEDVAAAPVEEQKSAKKARTAAPESHYACVIKDHQPEKPESLRSTLRLDDPRLGMGGIVGLVAALIVVRRRR